MILGFDFLGFQAIKHFPTKNRIFLHVMQCTVTNNSFLLVFYSYVLVFYPYVTGMYLVCTRMLLVCTRMYSYVTRMYLYVTRMYSCGVLVTILANLPDFVLICITCRKILPQFVTVQYIEQRKKQLNVSL